SFPRPEPLSTLTDLTAVSAGRTRVMALRGNGTVLDYPASGAPINGAPAGLSNVTVIAAGDTHSLALKSDGTVVGWNGALVPAGLSNVTAIAAGRNFSVVI